MSLTKTQDDSLFKLIDDACTNEHIRHLLRLRKEEDKELRISGNSDELIANLRAGYSRGTIQLAELQKLLASAEENGRQHIFFFMVKRAHQNRYSDLDVVASRMFGAKWRETEGFPRFALQPTSVEWSDFRASDIAARHPGWTAKLYNGREHERKISEKRERLDGRLIITKKFERDLVRLVMVVRWRPWGLLEFRIPTGDRESRKTCLAELNALWQLFSRALDRTHFSTWDLRDKMKTLSDTAENARALHRVSTTMTDDGAGNTAIFSPEIEGEDLFTSQAHKKAITNYPHVGKLDVYFRGPPTSPPTDETRVQFGVYEPYGIRIGSKVSPEALDHVIHAIRRV